MRKHLHAPPASAPMVSGGVTAAAGHHPVPLAAAGCVADGSASVAPVAVALVGAGTVPVLYLRQARVAPRVMSVGEEPLRQRQTSHNTVHKHALAVQGTLYLHYRSRTQTAVYAKQPAAMAAS